MTRTPTHHMPTTSTRTSGTAAQPSPAHPLTIHAPATTAISTTVAHHGPRRRRHHLQGEEAAAAWAVKEEAEQSRLAAVWASAPAKVVLRECV